MVVATERDKVVLMFLPIPLVLVGYWYFFFGSLQQEKRRVEQGVQVARGRAAQLPAKQMLVERLRQEVNEQQEQKKALEADWQRLTGLAGHINQQTQKIERLAQLLRDSGLIVVEQGEPDSKSAGLRDLEFLSKRVAEAAGKSRPLVWSVRVSGRYADLYRALQALANGEPVAIPLNISMTDASWEHEVREWTLLLWI
jgi:hypothetical protein